MLSNPMNKLNIYRKWRQELDALKENGNDITETDWGFWFGEIFEEPILGCWTAKGWQFDTRLKVALYSGEGDLLKCLTEVTWRFYQELSPESLAEDIQQLPPVNVISGLISLHNEGEINANEVERITSAMYTGDKTFIEVLSTYTAPTLHFLLQEAL